jgi:hypothetical protein
VKKVAAYTCCTKQTYPNDFENRNQRLSRLR